jgi:ABC-type branched-subunit amino acid transport system permease subunit
VPRPNPQAEHSLVLTVVVLLLLAAKGFVRGRAGHTRMAIRGIDVAARTIGIRPLRTKLLARPSRSTARSRYQCERRC